MTNQFSSDVIKYLMKSIPTNQRRKLARIMIDVENIDNSQNCITQLILDPYGLRLFRLMVRYLSDEDMNAIFTSTLLPKLYQYWNDPIVHHAVELFLSRISHPYLVSEAFAVLKDKMGYLYSKNIRGVLLPMMNACGRCRILEKECMEKIVEILKEELHVSGQDIHTFLNKMLDIKEEGGRVKMNEDLASFVYELLLLSPPFCYDYLLPILKWDFDVLLRMYLSCSMGQKMVLCIVNKMNNKDRDLWMSQIVVDKG
jgi:hypothetical protein